MQRKTDGTDCDDEHNRWYDQVGVNKIRMMIVGILTASMTTAAAILFFVISAQITSHELRDKDAMVSRREFEQTIQRIETSINRLDSSVNDALADMGEKLDRNLGAIKAKP